MPAGREVGRRQRRRKFWDTGRQAAGGVLTLAGRGGGVVEADLTSEEEQVL